MTPESRAELESIRDAARRALTLTESATLAIGDELRGVLETGRAHQATLQAELGRFSGEDASDDIVAITQAQGRVVGDFVGALSNLVEQQLAAVGRALAQASDIQRTGTTIDRAAREARMLSLNARITAEQADDDGAFGTIANEMQRLSEAVAEASRMVAEMTTGLGRQLPAIEEQGNRLREHGDAFGAEVGSLNGVVRDTSQRLHDCLLETVSNGDQHGETVLEAVQRVLGHLQFQDPMTQELRRILHLSQVALGEPSDVDTAAVGSAAGAAPVESGEVVLF
ncbi:MAG: hypothetical protein AAF533_22385 [Acidobacteriota bacterium]